MTEGAARKPGSLTEAALARLYRRGRITFALSAVCIAAVLVLVIADVEGRALGVAVSLAIFFGGVSWWSKGRYLLATGAVRVDWIVAKPESRGPVVRLLGVGFMALGGLAILLGAMLFAGAASW